jgi:hypothetical protein
LFKKNEELAYQYAKEAASAKLPTGAFAMGYYSEIGIHVPKSITEAKKWYQIAADQGNKDALARLDSLDQDKSLSKQDHETTTLTRIKSQHGSQRGKRPERFNKPQVMPAVDERGAHPAHGDQTPPLKLNPTNSLPALPITGLGATSQGAPYGAQGGASPMRPQSVAPYPVDDQPQPLNNRPKSTAPYPEDDMRSPNAGQHGPPGGRMPYGGPQADRPGSAFGIKTQQLPGAQQPVAPASQSMSNLNVPGGGDPRLRPISGGWDAQGRGGRQPSSGTGGQPYLGGDAGGYGRPASLQPSPANRLSPGPGPGPGRGQRPVSHNYPAGPGGGGGPRPHSAIPPAGMDPGRSWSGPARPASDMSSVGPHDPRINRLPVGGAPPMITGAVGHGGGRQTPGAMGPPGGPGLPSNPAPSRVGTAPPAQFQRPSESPRPSPVPSAASAPSKPSKGPATFEDMGIPQGKQDSDCVVM